eukprot:765766-Hanusia_phi.AAC.1
MRNSPSSHKISNRPVLVHGFDRSNLDRFQSCQSLLPPPCCVTLVVVLLRTISAQNESSILLSSFPAAAAGKARGTLRSLELQGRERRPGVGRGGAGAQEEEAGGSGAITRPCLGDSYIDHPGVGPCALLARSDPCTHVLAERRTAMGVSDMGKQ